MKEPGERGCSKAIEKGIAIIKARGDDGMHEDFSTGEVNVCTGKVAEMERQIC